MILSILFCILATLKSITAAQQETEEKRQQLLKLEQDLIIEKANLERDRMELDLDKANMSQSLFSVASFDTAIDTDMIKFVILDVNLGKINNLSIDRSYI